MGCSPGGNGQALQLDTATVTGTVTIPGTTPGTTTDTNSDAANYIGVTPGVTIDKQVSGNNSAWRDVDNGNLSDVPVILAAGQNGLLGSRVYFQAIVTNTTDQSLDMTGTAVTDANPSGTFAGATTVSVGTPQTYTLV